MIHCIYMYCTDGSLVIIDSKKYIVFLSLKIDFVLVNSADPDERQHSVVKIFHFYL